MSLFRSIWYDNNHWSSCGVCHDWNVWWSFWPGSWYLPFDYYPGMLLINTVKLLASPEYFSNNYCSQKVVIFKDLIHVYHLVDDFLFWSLSCLVLCKAKLDADHSHVLLLLAVLCWPDCSLAWWASAERIWTWIWVGGQNLISLFKGDPLQHANHSSKWQNIWNTPFTRLGKLLQNIRIQFSLVKHFKFLLCSQKRNYFVIILYTFTWLYKRVPYISCFLYQLAP